MPVCQCGQLIATKGSECERCRALQTLGLGPHATMMEIEEAYRTLVKVWHPDRFQNDKTMSEITGKKLADINAAYQYLLRHPASLSSSTKANPQRPSAVKDVREQQAPSQQIVSPIAIQMAAKSRRIFFGSLIFLALGVVLACMHDGIKTENPSADIQAPNHSQSKSPAPTYPAESMAGKPSPQVSEATDLLSSISSSPQESAAVGGPAPISRVDHSDSLSEGAGNDGAEIDNTVYHPGGIISYPKLIHSVQPEYPDGAKQAGLSGTVRLSLLVEKNGIPSHVQVVRGIGMGLDESAIAAVKQYRFEPAKENGKPVTVDLLTDVKFQLSQ
jgi:TonB family protein